jgi:PAS domain S-box-containing protein
VGEEASVTIELSQADETGTGRMKHVAVRAVSSDLDLAVSACDFAVVVWELPAAVVWLANQHAADLFGVPLLDLAGTKNTDLLGPSPSVTQAFAALESGAVEVVCAERRIRVPNGSAPVLAWSRAVELDGARALVSLYIPVPEVDRLGRDPSAPWRDLTPVAIGTADLQWRIDTISADIRELVGAEATEYLGTSLLDLVHPDDMAHLRRQLGPDVTVPRSHCYVRMRNGHGSWVEVCVLVANLDEDRQRIAFAAIGIPHATNRAAADRVRELELVLRHIGAEVRAAGVLDELETMPAVSDHPQLSELTTRQWEILSRLVRGDRVPTIADALYVSQSTVRNHLATIYAKFGVHSQAELLVRLRPPQPRSH